MCLLQVLGPPLMHGHGIPPAPLRWLYMPCMVM